MWNISFDIQLSILLYDVIHLNLTLIGCHYLLACPANQPESNRLPLSALPAATLRPDLLLQLPWLALFPTWQWSMFAKIPMVRKAIMESLSQGFRICAYFSDPLLIYWDIWTYRFSQSTVNYCTCSFIAILLGLGTQWTVTGLRIIRKNHFLMFNFNGIYWQALYLIITFPYESNWCVMSKV